MALSSLVLKDSFIRGVLSSVILFLLQVHGEVVELGAVRVGELVAVFFYCLAELTPELFSRLPAVLAEHDHPSVIFLRGSVADLNVRCLRTRMLLCGRCRERQLYVADRGSVSSIGLTASSSESPFIHPHSLVSTWIL